MHRVILALIALLLLNACATFGRARPVGEPARRLVLALDGIDYRDVVAAREQGMFAEFRAPSRLISTFPSISDVAWHDIFGILPPAGYQRVYYSHTRNAMIGGALDAIRPIEYEQRMDLAFGEKLHHLGAYLLSGTVSRREADVTVEKFWRFTDRNTVYVYNVGPDALQHTRGDLTRYFQHLDEKLTELSHEYLARTGRRLEIVILSDHGHNRASSARFLPMVPALEALGFRIATSISEPRDIAFSVDGVTTGFGVFAHRTMLDSVARSIARLEGVDVVTVHAGGDSIAVYGGTTIAENSRATIDFRRAPDGTRRVRYRPGAASDADPLEYRSLLQRTARNSDGFIAESAWVQLTRGARYPAAPPRIVRGHFDVTRNPAPILVSVRSDYRVGLGAVSIANRMRPLGGTHGSLDTAASLGVLMTNFVDTHDALTSAVRTQLGGFDDLGYRTEKLALLRLVDDSLLARDRLAPFRAIVDLPPAPLAFDTRALQSVPVATLPDSVRRRALAYEVRMPAEERWSADSTWLEVSWERLHDVGRAEGLGRIALDSVPLARVARSPDGSRVLVPVHPELRGPLVPRSVYSLTVRLRRRGDTKRLGTLTVATDANGIPRVE